MSKVLCSGSGRPARAIVHNVYPHCPVCDRPMAAQGRKAQIRFRNAWAKVPRHYIEASA